jgi:hypothetical protein
MAKPHRTTSQPDDQSYEAFLRQQRRDAEVIDRFERHLDAYCREHPDADEAAVRAHAELLAAAIPGLWEALGMEALEHRINVALVADRGDGLPGGGPCARWDDGERLWTSPEQWTLEDFRVTLAWYREPGAPAPQRAALLAYGERRWPGEDFSRGPWPDTSDLPAWEELARDLIDDEDDDEAP